MATVRGETIWLPNLARENFFIEGMAFEDCEFLGPAVLALVNNTTLEENDFDGTPETTVFAVPFKGITWAIGLRNVTIRKCRFRRVGIVCPPEQLEAVRSGFGAGERT